MKKGEVLRPLLTACLILASFCLTSLYAQGVSEQDRKFLLNAYRSNMVEVDLSRNAAERGWNDEVRRLGSQLLNTHVTENMRLEAIAEKKGLSLPGQLDDRDRESVEKMGRLEGREFDRAYIEAMTRLHSDDLEEFRREAEEGTDPELIKFSKERIHVLKRHLWLSRRVGEVLARE